jgi:hypothetical protein
LEVGKGQKLVHAVEQISFSGRRAIAQGQEILYVTERCMLRLEPEGVTVKASRLSERSARRTLSTGKMGLRERSSAADLTNREPTNGFWNGAGPFPAGAKSGKAYDEISQPVDGGRYRRFGDRICDRGAGR